jgi:hypothetical protein
MNMKWIAGMVLCFLSFSSSGQSSMLIPRMEKPIMMDGKFDAKEWEGSIEIMTNDSVSILLYQSQEFVYIAVRSLHSSPQIMEVDLYLQLNTSTLTNLHASAKLGERVYNGKNYGDWNWWNNKNWVANIARLDKLPSGFLFDEVKEFQISKELLPNNSIRIMLTTGYPFKMNFPESAEINNTAKWLSFDMD